MACGGKGNGGGIRDSLARVVGSVVGITLGEIEGICWGTTVGRIVIEVQAIFLVGRFVVACWKMVANYCRASICLLPVLENGSTGAGCWRA